MSFSKLIFAILATTVCSQQGTTVKITCADVNTFVNIHNTFRRQLARGERELVPKQSKAANMRIMSWDDELAAKAETYAKKGQFEHNTDRTVPSGRFVTGENLYILKTNNPKVETNMTQPVAEWFDEYKEYKFGKMILANYKGKNIGHYTQIVWANTTYVCCGVSKKVAKGWTSLLYVCNYGPPGNIINQYPSETGKGCEDLCGSPGNYGLYGKNCPSP